jgi:hypothetical protein
MPSMPLVVVSLWFRMTSGKLNSPFKASGFGNPLDEKPD